jgi:2',3'-cyclic-nucleotide 2'-phosphodiesterase (5'-nucleotidase family)
MFMNRIFLVLLSFIFGISSLLISDLKVVAKEYPRKATVLYFNDAHEISPVVNQYGDRGGVAWLKTIIDRVREENPKAIVTFGGDLGGGTLFGGVFQGFLIVQAFNEI